MLTFEGISPESKGGRLTFKSLTKFTNWSRTYSCIPFRTFYPTSEEHVKNIINIARKSGRSVRAVGGGLSPSDLACSDDFLINTDGLNKILDVNLETGLVQVQGGIRLFELNKELDKIGLALSNLGSISEQSLAGAVGSAAHGTGIRFGSISTQIREVVFYDSFGERHVAKKSDVDQEVEGNLNDDIFNAALCHLGCIGIIVALTIQCEPSFKLQIHQCPTYLDEVLNNLEDVINKEEHVRFWWFPQVAKDLNERDTVVWNASRTSKKLKPAKNNWFWDKLVRVYVFEFLLFVGKYVPKTIPWINRVYFSNFFDVEQKSDIIEKSYNGFNFDCLFSQHVTEWAIPIQNTKEALTRLRFLLNTPTPSGGFLFNVHFPIEVRFVQKDNILLSPAYHQDVCYIGIIMYRPYKLDIPFEDYWEAYENIMFSLGGKPHWAKSHKLTPSQLSVLYPKMSRFLEIRAQLDPSGLFLNPYIRRHLVAG